MKQKNIKIVIYIFIVLSTIGCSIDDITPLNLLTEENVVQDEASAEALLNRVYNLQRSFEYSWVLSGMTLSGTEQDRINGFFNDEGFATNNVLDTNGTILGAYIIFYNIINHANFLIDQLEAGKAPDLSETRKKEMIAEARLFRALSHFNLLRHFGKFYDLSSDLGIVVSSSPINEAVYLERNTVQETYRSIVEDLQFTVLNAPSGREHYYVNSTFAQSLLAKVYLYMGNFDNAAATSLNVINNTDTFSLEPVYEDIFSKRWKSSEVLFAPFVDGSTEKGPPIFFGINVMSPSSLFRVLADDQDGVSNDGDIATNSSGYDPRFMFAYNVNTLETTGNGKYPFVDFSLNDDQGNTFYYMRMAEVYLIYAEAEARRSGGVLSDALQRLNQIRNRAGVAPKKLVNQINLLEDIRNEKMLELFTESAETWFDLVRYDRLGELNIVDFKPSIATENKLILPIPRNALSGNNLLVPNP
ncbi:RagB/SusD family nutrient uptake outer membrane protein [Aquimarina sp. I32.4]|uniref:RagB/SusD family nutrient uptake outer membrane protein n=1 Tax=Aquimarina sp. I32.4 TaxID=2053903 RepID=UPI000CDEC494|nr:RagB/SusD family nutrient uptake outer membrane protein [Aquimarina sp. I32.4]